VSIHPDVFLSSKLSFSTFSRWVFNDLLGSDLINFDERQGNQDRT
jgi:hypothetical protein